MYVEIMATVPSSARGRTWAETPRGKFQRCFPASWLPASPAADDTPEPHLQVVQVVKQVGVAIGDHSYFAPWTRPMPCCCLPREGLHLKPRRQKTSYVEAT